MEIPLNTLYCVHCSHPLYFIEIPERIYTEPQNHRKATVNVEFSNQGSAVLELHSFRILGQDFDLKGFLVYPGTNDARQIPLAFTTDITERMENVEVSIQGKIGEQEITAKEKLILCPYPQLEIVRAEQKEGENRDELWVGPTTGYNIRLKVELKNKSLVEIPHLNWEIREAQSGSLVVGGEEPFPNPILLPKNGNHQGEITLSLPSDKFKSHVEYVLSLRIRDLEAPLFELKLKCLELPEISLVPFWWTEEGKKEDDTTPDKLSWKVVAESERKKDFTIKFLGDDKKWCDVVQIQKCRLEPQPPKGLIEVKTEHGVMAPSFDYRANLGIQVGKNYEGKLVFEVVDHRTPSTVSKSFPLYLTTIPTEAYPHPIGMDFGTSNSSLAIVLPDEDNEINPARDVFPIPVEEYSAGWDARIMPSVVFLDRNNLLPIAIGRAAAFRQGSEVIKSVKRRIIEGIRCEFNGRDVKEQVALSIMKELLRRAMEYLEERGNTGFSFPEVCLAVPTMASPGDVATLVSCCRGALKELDVPDSRIETVDECYAALLYSFRYEIKPEELCLGEGDRILMYDFGGGTSDVNLVQYNKNQRSFETIDVSGDLTLGGDDVTKKIKAILDELEKEAQAKGQQQTDEEKTNRAEFVKQAFGDEQKYKEFSLGISREELIRRINEELLRPSITEILKDIGILREETNDEQKQIVLADDKLKMVILAGGASQLAGFLELIAELLPGVTVRRLQKPKLSVAIGAFMCQHGGALIFTPFRGVPFRVLLSLGPGPRPEAKVPVVTMDKTHYAVLIKRGEQYGATGLIQKAYSLNDLGFAPGFQGASSVYFQYGVGRLRLKGTQRINLQNANAIQITLDYNNKLEIKPLP
jgi:hypothetical protein